MSAVCTERALKQPNVIESLYGVEPDMARCLLVTVESSDDAGCDSTPAMKSRNATTTVAVDFSS